MANVGNTTYTIGEAFNVICADTTYTNLINYIDYCNAKEDSSAEDEGLGANIKNSLIVCAPQKDTYTTITTYQTTYTSFIDNDDNNEYNIGDTLLGQYSDKNANVQYSTNKVDTGEYDLCVTDYKGDVIRLTPGFTEIDKEYFTITSLTETQKKINKDIEDAIDELKSTDMTFTNIGDKKVFKDKSLISYLYDSHYNEMISFRVEHDIYLSSDFSDFNNAYLGRGVYECDQLDPLYKIFDRIKTSECIEQIIYKILNGDTINVKDDANSIYMFSGPIQNKDGEYTGFVVVDKDNKILWQYKAGEKIEYTDDDGQPRSYYSNISDITDIDDIPENTIIIELDTSIFYDVNETIPYDVFAKYGIEGIDTTIKNALLIKIQNSASSFNSPNSDVQFNIYTNNIRTISSDNIGKASFKIRVDVDIEDIDKYVNNNDGVMSIGPKYLTLDTSSDWYNTYIKKVYETVSGGTSEYLVKQYKDGETKEYYANNQFTTSSSGTEVSFIGLYNAIQDVKDSVSGDIYNYNNTTKKYEITNEFISYLFNSAYFVNKLVNALSDKFVQIASGCQTPMFLWTGTKSAMPSTRNANTIYVTTP